MPDPLEPSMPEVVDAEEVLEPPVEAPAPKVDTSKAITVLENAAKTLASTPGAHRAKSRVLEAIEILKNLK